MSTAYEMNYGKAIDEMFSLFLEAWKAGAPEVLGLEEAPEIVWPGQDGKLPDMTKYWCRVSQQTVLEEQTALADNEGKKRYTTSGLIFVQLFCPKSDASAMAKGKKLAPVARNAFRGKTTSGKVWFRRARIQELTPEDNAYRFNVVAEYEYDEIN